MVEVSVVGDRVHFEVEGMDKLWAMKSRLDIPLRHVRAARIDPEAAKGLWHGLRFPGTQIPGVILAGSFYQFSGWVFYDVHDPERTVIVELEHEHYECLVIEVSDPQAVLSKLQSAIATQ